MMKPEKEARWLYRQLQKRNLPREDEIALLGHTLGAMCGATGDNAHDVERLLALVHARMREAAGLHKDDTIQ